MIHAVQECLSLHPTVDPDRLGIWLVCSEPPAALPLAKSLTASQNFACIDQDSPEPGVNALPLLLAQ
jgi:hypothetical protein